METKLCKMHIGRHTDRSGTVSTYYARYLRSVHGYCVFDLELPVLETKIHSNTPKRFSPLPNVRDANTRALDGRGTSRTVRVRNDGQDGRKKDFCFFGGFAANKLGTFEQTK